jgi:hypothetical protein
VRAVQAREGVFVACCVDGRTVDLLEGSWSAGGVTCRHGGRVGGHLLRRHGNVDDGDMLQVGRCVLSVAEVTL